MKQYLFLLNKLEFILYLKYLIFFCITVVIASLGIYCSSSAKKTIIDIGTKVGTAVITGVAAGATNSIVNNKLNGDKDDNNDDDKDKNKDKKKNSDNKTETSDNSK